MHLLKKVITRDRPCTARQIFEPESGPGNRIWRRMNIVSGRRDSIRQCGEWAVGECLADSSRAPIALALKLFNVGEEEKFDTVAFLKEPRHCSRLRPKKGHWHSPSFFFLSLGWL
jgi:hypothetical protein